MSQAVTDALAQRHTQPEHDHQARCPSLFFKLSIPPLAIPYNHICRRKQIKEKSKKKNLYGQAKMPLNRPFHCKDYPVYVQHQWCSTIRTGLERTEGVSG